MPSQVQILKTFGGKNGRDRLIAYSQYMKDVNIYGQDVKYTIKRTGEVRKAKQFILTKTPFDDICRTDINCYEMATPDRPTNIYFDLDDRDLPTELKTVDECVDYFVDAYESVRSIYGIPKPDWRISEAFGVEDDKVKRSLRFVDHANAVSCIDVLKVIYRLISAHIPVDMSVARKYGLLRFIGQTKLGSNRPLRKVARCADCPDAEFSIHCGGAVVSPDIKVLDTAHEVSVRNRIKNERTHKNKALLRYVIEHLPDTYGDESKSRWVEGVALAKAYGSKELAHLIAKKSKHYNADSTDKLYESATLVSYGNHIGKLFHVIQSTMTPEAYDAFVGNSPRHDTVPFNPVWTECPELVRVNTPKIDVESDIATWMKQTGSLVEPDDIFYASPMMTYKSQAMLVYVDGKIGILMLTDRVNSVNDYRYEKFPGFMKAYNEANVSKDEDNLINTINSITKFSGTKKYLILDELNSILKTATSFVKNKTETWRALKDYMSSAKHMVCMDALLTQERVDIIREMRRGCGGTASPTTPLDVPGARGSHPRTCMVVVNDYKPMTGRVANCALVDDMSSSLIDLGNKLVSGQTVGVPTNSVEYAKAAAALCEKNNIPHFCMIAGSEHEPASKWKTVQCVIYSPTITHGVSQNDIHFDNIHAYFTNKSAPPDMAFQQIGRIRNVKSNTIDIHYNHCPFMVQDETIEGVVAHTNNKINIIGDTGLRYNHVSQQVKQNAFFKAYAITEIEKSKGQNNFLGILKGYLEHHGYTVNDTTVDEISKQVVDEFNVELKQAMTKLKESDAVELISARNIDHDMYEMLKTSDDRTDRLAVNKYLVSVCYGAPSTGEFVLENTPEMVKFVVKNCGSKNLERRRRYKAMMQLVKREQRVDGEVLTLDRKLELLNKRNNDKIKKLKNGDVVDYNTTPIKMKHLLSIVAEAGFDVNNFDIVKVPAYTKLLAYYHRHQKELQTLWKRKAINSTDNKCVMTYFSSILKEFGLSLHKASKHKDDPKRILCATNRDELIKFGIDVNFDKITDPNVFMDENGHYVRIDL